MGIDDAEDDEFVTSDYKSLRDVDGWQRCDPWGGSSASRPKRVSMTSAPTHMIFIILPTFSSPYTSAIPTAASGASVFSESREAPPSADNGRLAETQSLLQL